MSYSPEHRRQFLAAMMVELEHAYAKHGARPWSRHEFYGVLAEEVDEVWDAIKADDPIENVLKEVMQIACVCLRYAETPDAYRGTHPLPMSCRIDVETAVNKLDDMIGIRGLSAMDRLVGRLNAEER